MSVWLVVGLAVAAALYCVVIYNRLVGDRNRVLSAWSDVDVQLKRRSDLIPKLVDTVRQYTAYEQATLEAVIQLRQQAAVDGVVSRRAATESALEAGVHRLLALVEAYPETGRTHQIRVHFAWLGHPLVGDKVYGRKKPSLPIERHFLHAAGLTLRMPSTGEERTFQSPLPQDLERVLAMLVQE